MRVLPPMLLSFIAIALAACGDARSSVVIATPPPFVKTEPVKTSVATSLGLSGIVRARTETPLAFQVGGRITARKVDAGKTVAAGDLLFELDRRDLEQAVLAAEAILSAAQSAFDAANADLIRHRQLVVKHFVSAQALQLAEDAARQASGRRDAAQAHLNQARNALGYGRLRAPADGVLIEVSGEVGQVVAAGQGVAVLAQSGKREVEVFFPERVVPPTTGEMLLDGGSLVLTLREKAGAVDPVSRTLRARYTLDGPSDTLMLGSVVRTRFRNESATSDVFSVPLAAISERGTGPRVWRFSDGQVKSVPVSILSLDTDHAQVSGPLHAGDHVVALGTHLLTEDMRARELVP